MRKLQPLNKLLVLLSCCAVIVAISGVFHFYTVSRRHHERNTGILLFDDAVPWKPSTILIDTATSKDEILNTRLKLQKRMKIKDYSPTIKKRRMYIRDLMYLVGRPQFDLELQDDIDVLLQEFVHTICYNCATYSKTFNSKQLNGSTELNFNDHSSKSSFSVLNEDKLNEHFFVPRTKVLNVLPYKFSLLDDSFCSLSNGEKPFLLALIPTVRDHMKTRNVIRETWGSPAYKNGTWANTFIKDTFRLIFFMGSASFNASEMAEITKEANQYGDILLADFIDSYRNLSLKMMIGLNWIDKFCPGVRHVVKVDEDTFVHVPRLIQMIKEVQAKHSSFVLGRGTRFQPSIVLRRGKWAVGPEYPLAYYPVYVYGHSYVISGPAIKMIVNTFRHMPLVANEDAFITGILSKTANVTRLGSRFFAIGSFKTIICHISQGDFVSVTELCDHHHRAIYDDIKNGFCDWRIPHKMIEPGCRFNSLR